jgi:hypothetical protein
MLLNEVRNPDISLTDEVIDNHIFINALEMYDIFLLQDRYFKDLIPLRGFTSFFVRKRRVGDTSV